MAHEATVRLSGFLERNIEDDLRSVVHYTSDDHEIVFVRDDIEGAYSPKEIESMVDNLRIENLDRHQQEDIYVHGELNCSIRCFERGVVMHFPHRKTEGTVVGLDPQVTEDLYSFIGDCLTFIQLDD